MMIVLLLWFGLQPITPHLFEVPDHGRLRMVVPPEWKVVSTARKTPPVASVHMGPSIGDGFDLQMTTIWLDAARRAKMTPDVVKDNVRRSGETLLKEAENKSVIIDDLKGEDVAGYYFTLADSNPKPGEFRYVTQGTFVTGELMTAFTFLHRLPDTEDLALFLRMLAGTRQVP